MNTTEDDLNGSITKARPKAFVSIENLTSTEYREAQFFFTSRLAGEPASDVPDIHYTRGNPRSVLGGLAVRF